MTTCLILSLINMLLSQSPEQFIKVFWQGGCEFHVLLCAWMHDSQDSGVKGLPGQSGDRAFGRAVNMVTQQWMVKAGHMHSDLVGPSCLQAAFHIGKLAKTL